MEMRIPVHVGARSILRLSSYKPTLLNWSLDSQNMSGSTEHVGHSAVNRKESVMGKKVKKICAKVL